jgi:peptidoglycan-N-acetylglucosamine deacetylase
VVSKPSVAGQPENRARPAQFAGISWSKAGYEVTVVTASGRLVTTARFFPDEAERLVSWLRAQERPPHRLAVILDSTNGLLDGPLTGAGLEVYRADPPILPDRPTFGSVPSAMIADRARMDLGAMARVTSATGALAGRIAEHNLHMQRAVALEKTMADSGRYVGNGSDQRRAVALTFDDGPSPVFTPRILDILARFEVRATFFCVGMNCVAYPKLLERIHAEGHAIGNHTWSHAFLPDLDLDELELQLGYTSDAIAAAIGVSSNLIRPPYGSRTPEIVRWIASRGLRMVLWHTDSEDWSAPGANAIVSRVLDQAREGSVILMHDGCGDRSQTVAALPAVITTLLSRGLVLSSPLLEVI